ncbi:MAG: DUF2279 domain-containing protein [Flavobacteriales bacterium]|nr:DUF2279 domain-containing protein [Flavobacteriales bacterium]
MSVTLTAAQVTDPTGPVTSGSRAGLDTSKGTQGSCRTWTAVAAGGVMLGTYALLDQAWYAQYDRSPLHSFDDSGEWMQMDKAGHMFSAYTLGRWGHASWQRCGVDEREAILIGGSMGFLFLTGVEILDGTSAGWGFSWSDMAANAAGAGLFMGQQAGWGEQRIYVKFSSHPTSYAEQYPELLGEGTGERILKDYNGQTIWLSTNLWSFRKGSDLPEWLSLGFGYGAEGMVSAHPQDPENSTTDLESYRQYFLSPDVDLTRIKTKSKFLRTVLFVLNGIKVPMPALEFRSNGRVLAHGLYF